MKKLYQGLLMVLCLILICFGFVSLVDKDQTTSIIENRTLASRPEFTVSGWFDGSFAEEYDTYYSDTFPLRETLLQWNKNLNHFYYYSGAGEDNVLSINYSGGAEQGGESLTDHQKDPDETQTPNKDVTPPQSGDTQDPPEDPDQTVPDPSTGKQPDENSQTADPPRSYPDESEATAVGTIIIVGDNAMDVPTATYEIIDRYAEAVDHLASAMQPGVRTFSLVTPNSSQFYSPESFHTGPHDQKKMIDACYEHMSSGILTVDAYAALEAHQDEYIYFRTDHHWTALGAYYAYTEFCKTAGFQPVALSEFETGTYENFVGSMYTYTSNYPQSDALLNHPDTVTYYLPKYETHAKYYLDATLTDGIPISVVSTSLADNVSNKYLCFICGDTPICTIESQADGPTCLVLKESYGNAFVPFLTSHYSKIIVVDPREFNRDGKPSLDLAAFAKEQDIDDLIVINYPFMINNSSYIEWLNRLVGMGAQE